MKNEHDLDLLLHGARRAGVDAALPGDFACRVQSALPPRMPRLCTRGMMLALALLLPATAVGAAWVTGMGKGRTAPPTLTLYQGGGLQWQRPR